MNPEQWIVLGSLIKKIPSFIPMTIIKRPYGGSSCNPSEVKSVSDLPKRAFMGTIDETTFEISENGWSASYFGYEKGTQVVLKYDVNKKHLDLSQTWRGMEGYPIISRGDKFGYIARSTGPIPEKWDETAKRELEDRYNLQYVLAQEKLGTQVAFPDGFSKTLICPVPVSKLRDAFNFIKNLDQDLSIETGVMGYLNLTQSVVNYVKGKNGEIGSDPLRLFLHTYDELGTASLGFPKWETAPDGSEALTVSRYHYVLVLDLFFRETYKVIDKLHYFGLIGNSNEYTKTDHYPSSSEYLSVILPGGLVAQPFHFSSFDPLGRRRTFYEKFTSIEDIEKLSKLEFDEASINSLIGEAEHNSKQIGFQLSEIFKDYLS